MTDDTRYMILQYVIEVIKVLIPFFAVTFVITTALKLSIRAGLHSRASSSSSSANRQTLETSTKIQLAHHATKHELEVSQLKRIMKEKEDAK